MYRYATDSVVKQNISCVVPKYKLYCLTWLGNIAAMFI
jgi:hypothetical protein